MPKRQVSYNPKAVLCPFCTKRIRLNNDGRLRIHQSGRMGSGNCEGSGAELAVEPPIFAELHNQAMVTKTGRVLTDDDLLDLAEEAVAGYDIDTVTPLFLEPS
jgi:hypothetical protein